MLTFLVSQVQVLGDTYQSSFSMVWKYTTSVGVYFVSPLRFGQVLYLGKLDQKTLFPVCMLTQLLLFEFPGIIHIRASH